LYDRINLSADFKARIVSQLISDFEKLSFMVGFEYAPEKILSMQ